MGGGECAGLRLIMGCQASTASWARPGIVGEILRGFQKVWAHEH